ncbi:tyrosine-protein phosphatase [Streptomyces poonensis]|uniref:Protein-tyrosine-phosphatase n=1 Tax=Streptomyces poonensis TaxID=68255 RepID=A0A918PEZ7_9ACTN|nr:tyrosine-protein phosphatase [Streptomyces poonensis]GGZ04843.1 protein-tyrosine-phosphatase [Streptomyces poonensis]GLJ89431.1 protein-tyrosine-phosphatase [Streptomyces poonensis]
MTQQTRARTAAYALTAAVLLTGAVAPAATAAPAHHAQQAQKDSARIPFTAAEVTAQDDGSYEITWKAPGVHRVTIRANGRTVASGGSTGKVTVRHLPAADRQWFDLVPDRGGRLHLADRLIKLEGTVNFRDAGGYRTKDGHWVRMGVVYRSDALDKLTDADLAKLKRLGLSVDYDLRTTSEKAAAPDRVPQGVRYVAANVLGDDSPVFSMPSTADEAAQMMVDGEKAMVSADTAKAAYSTIFADLSDGDPVGTLYHCTAGKDRTGWASAALLTALGVPRGTVMEDYLASNDYRAEANAAALAAMPAAQAAVYKPMLDVRAEYLNSGFEEVEEAYGSFTAYEKKGLGLDARELKRLKAELLVG